MCKEQHCFCSRLKKVLQEEKKAEAKPEEAGEAMDTEAGAAAPEPMEAGEEHAAGAGPQPTSVEEPMEQ